MARIPQPRARDFQLQATPGVRAPDPIRAQGLEHLGRVLVERGFKLGADEARREGVEAQAASSGEELVKRDSSFFGFFDAAFDEGARFVFQKQKRIQVDELIGELEARHPRDPKAFEKAVGERRDEVFAKLPSDVQAGVRLYFKQESARASLRLTKAAVAREKRGHRSEFLLEIERAARAASLQVEDGGEVEPETQGTLDALRDRAAELDFLPTEIEQLERKVRDDLSVSSLVHQYRNLPAEQRNEWARSLLTPDGPLGDRSFVERTQIVAKIRSVDDLDKAEARARRGILIKRANDAIAVEKRGHQHRDTPLIQAGLTALAADGDIDAALKLEQLNGTVRVRETLELSRTSNEADVQAMIAELRRVEADPEGGITVSQSAMLEGLEAGLAERRKAVAEGSLLDYVERHGIDLSRVGFEGKSRAEQVAFLKNLYGTDNVRFFTETEFEARADAWKNGSAADREALLAEISREVPSEDLGAVLKRFSRSDKGLPIALHMVASGDEDRLSVAREILVGTEFMNENPDLLEKANAVADQLRGRLSRIFAEDATGALVAAYTDAALAVYANRRRRAGNFNRNISDINRALQDVLGGEIASINGHEIAPLAPGASQSQSRDIWNSVTDDDLRRMAAGAGPLPTELSGLPVDNTVTGQMLERDAEQIREDGWPIPAPGDGLFYIAMPRAPGTFGPGDVAHYILTDPRTRRPFVFDPGKLTGPGRALPPNVDALGEVPF